MPQDFFYSEKEGVIVNVIEEVIKNIAEHFKWPPEKIGGLFCDRVDFYGLYFWWDHVVKMNPKK